MLHVLDPTAQGLLFREARTANTFTDGPIQAIYGLVKYGPAAFNQSPLRVTVVCFPDARERQVKHTAPADQAKTAVAPLVAILSTDIEFDESCRGRARTSRKPRAYSSPSAGPSSGPPTSTALRRPRTSSSASARDGLVAGPMNGFDNPGAQAEFLDDDHAPLFICQRRQTWPLRLGRARPASRSRRGCHNRRTSRGAGRRRHLMGRRECRIR